MVKHYRIKTSFSDIIERVPVNYTYETSIRPNGDIQFVWIANEAYCSDYEISVMEKEVAKVKEKLAHGKLTVHYFDGDLEDLGKEVTTW